MKKLNLFICYSLILLFALQGTFVSSITRPIPISHDNNFKVRCIATPCPR